MKKLATLFFDMFRIALFVVGGGYAIISVAEEVFSKKRKWLKEGELLDQIALFQMVPGILAAHSAVYVGRRVAGLLKGMDVTVYVSDPYLSDADAEATRTALLDVMTDEANSDHNPLNALGNCFITPHIAGSAGQEVWRMAQYMLDEFERFQRGEACRYEVTPAMLATMA